MKKQNAEITKENLEKVEGLLNKIETMSNDEYKKFIKTISVFHNYSFNNQVILYLSGAVNVKGFQQWKQVDRTVKKGSKAIWILAPKIAKFKEVLKDENGNINEEENQRLYGFKSVPVFDYKDTEGKELEYMTVESKASLCSILRVAKELNLNVQFEELEFLKGGYIEHETADITINSIHNDSDKAHTLIHEISHYLLGHHEKGNEISREVKEQQAETPTYLICESIGISAKCEFYLNSWKMDKDILKSFNLIDKAYKQFMDLYDTVK